jgi:protein subunit release factor B
MGITHENYPQPFRFTQENARENAAKSWQSRRERKAKLEAEAQQGRKSTPQSERLALQIERVEQMMDKTKDPDALQKLSATHARLFNAWQILTGTPNPGSSRNRGSRQSEPALPAPTPQKNLPEIEPPTPQESV